MVECIFGWGKQHGTMRKAKHRGIAVAAGDFMLNLIAYNLVRIRKAHRCLSSNAVREMPSGYAKATASRRQP